MKMNKKCYFKSLVILVSLLFELESGGFIRQNRTVILIYKDRHLEFREITNKVQKTSPIVSVSVFDFFVVVAECVVESCFCH